MSMYNPYATPVDYSSNDEGIFVKNPDTYNPYQTEISADPVIVKDPYYSTEILVKQPPTVILEDYYTTRFAGRVLDAQSGSAVPGATVRLLAGGSVINQAIADGNGDFDVAGLADVVQVSSVGYKTVDFSADPGQTEYKLPRDAKDLPPVVLPPGGSGGKNTGLLLLGLLAVVLLSTQKSS